VARRDGYTNCRQRGDNDLFECLDERYRNEFYACYGFIPSRIQQLTNPNLIVEVDISPQPGGVRLDGRLPQNIRPRYLVKLGAYPHQIVLSLFTTMFLHANWVLPFHGVIWTFVGSMNDDEWSDYRLENKGMELNIKIF